MLEEKLKKSVPDIVSTPHPRPSPPGFLFYHSYYIFSLKLLPNLLRTVFQPTNIFDIDGQAVNETTSNGECTRIGTNVGQCTFTFIDTVDGFSITATGVISGDTDGGKLAITGGTGRYSGIIGSLELTPIFSEDAASEDIFLDVLGYQTKAEFGTLICRPTAPHIE